MSQADFTVFVPNYNHGKYLPRSLGAIFAQSVQPRDVLVIDDCSTDDSVAVVEQFAKRHPTLRLVRNERNRGVVFTMNRGVELTRTRWLVTSAADDYVLPGFYEKSLAMLERHPEAGLSFANDAFQFGESGEVQSNFSGWPAEAAFYDPEGVCRHLRHTIPGHSTVYNVAALRAAGGFDPDLAWYCDWFANLTLAFRHGAVHIPEALAVRVLLDVNYSSEAKPGAKHIQVLKTFFDRISSPAFADVLPWFQKNGAPTYFGTDLIRAAATRPDLWQPHVLGFLNGFTNDQYRDLRSDTDPEVRRVAEFFLGPFWRKELEREQESSAVAANLREELEAAKRRMPPNGAAAKMKWLAGLVWKRFRRAG
jgi:glycosyltransferase involved in cell wall biosynthesis